VKSARTSSGGATASSEPGMSSGPPMTPLLDRAARFLKRERTIEGTPTPKRTAPVMPVTPARRPRALPLDTPERQDDVLMTDNHPGKQDTLESTDADPFEEAVDKALPIETTDFKDAEEPT